MDISIDNHVSTALMNQDNELCPFHLSVSCWALSAFYVVDLLAGVKHSNAHAANLFHTVLIETVGLLAILMLLRYRLAQTALLKTESHPPLNLVKRMSSTVLSVVGACLVVILFSLIG